MQFGELIAAVAAVKLGKQGQRNQKASRLSEPVASTSTPDNIGSQIAKLSKLLKNIVVACFLFDLN